MTKKISKEKLQLAVEKRKIFGRKIKKLRREGFLPANIYGKKIKSLSVQLPLKDFLPIYQKAGETALIELKISGEEKKRPILIHNVQLDSVSDQPLHADFYQVDLKQKITTDIPAELIGESPAVAQKIGILIQPLDEIEVEALPTDLPDKFEVDISSLKEVNNVIVVGDLKSPAGVQILNSPKEILAKIEPLAKEEAPPPPSEEAAPAEEVPGEVKPGEEKPPEKAEKPQEGAKETKKKSTEEEKKPTKPPFLKVEKKPKTPPEKAEV